jgi:glycosyltransferase involved in cell wall biosynthesis
MEQRMINQYMQPLSVIVPTLNEIDSMPLLFDRINETLTSALIPYEIVVVDDHSTDGTAEYVAQADPKYNARLITKIGERGKSFSLLEGFAAAKYELICMIDGDLQYPPEAIKLMYHKLQYLEADIVLTNRAVNSTSKLRQLSSFVFNLLFTRLLFGINYDTQSGLKLFRRDVLRHMSLSPSPWTFDLEFIVRALENDYVITSQDIVFSERLAGQPKIKMINGTIEIASGALKLWSNSSTKRVKLRYKYLEALNSKALLLAGVVTAGVIMLSGAASQKADALSLPVSSPELASVSKNIDHVVSGLAKQQSTPSTLTPTTTPTSTPASSSASPASLSQATGLSSTTTTSNSQSSAGSPTLAPSSSNSNYTDTSAGASSTSPTHDDEGLFAATRSAYYMTTAASSPTSSTPSPTSDSTQSAKNAEYYQPTKLSTSLTSRLLKIAIYIMGLAGILIFGSLFIMGTRRIINRITRQPLRN